MSPPSHTTKARHRGREGSFTVSGSEEGEDPAMSRQPNVHVSGVNGKPQPTAARRPTEHPRLLRVPRARRPMDLFRRDAPATDPSHHRCA